MTTNDTTNNQQLNGLQMADEYRQFIEASVIPAVPVSAEAFWTAFADVVACAHDETATAATASSAARQGRRPIMVRECTAREPVNPGWGSLYDALYNNSVIPHTAGLKPGNNLNIARHDLVVRFGKDFLDKTFPLSEGSHRDAVSYLVYFQNLLVILADGSTTGLQQPKQYVGKNGPADAPDSILLRHNGIHTEVMFDRNGNTGANDLASIDDIQLETSENLVFDFQANSIGDKCSTYRNWLNIVRHQGNKTFSDRSGEHCFIEHNNWAITSSATDSDCALIRHRDKPVQAALIDLLTAALIEVSHSQSITHVNVYMPQASTTSNDGFVEKLQQLLSMCSSPDSAEIAHSTLVKVLPDSADTIAQWTRRPQNARECAVTDTPVGTATIGTMQSHGYDVEQASIV